MYHCPFCFYLVHFFSQLNSSFWSSPFYPDRKLIGPVILWLVWDWFRARGCDQQACSSCRFKVCCVVCCCCCLFLHGFFTLACSPWPSTVTELALCIFPRLDWLERESFLSVDCLSWGSKVTAPEIRQGSPFGIIVPRSRRAASTSTMTLNQNPVSVSFIKNK